VVPAPALFQLVAEKTMEELSGGATGRAIETLCGDAEPDALEVLQARVTGFPVTVGV
jgi:hypothetical protein